jgi:hypothetical protein
MGLQAIPSEGWHSWHSGLIYRRYHRQTLILSDMATGQQEQPEDGPRRRRRWGPRDSHESAVGRLEQLAGVGPSNPALR